MHSPFYVLVWVSAVCSLWILWDKGIKSLLLAGYRERLFELRFALFDMAMRGKLEFDSDVYRQLELLLCGLLRFGHRMTLLTFIYSSREQSKARKEKDYVDFSRQIALKISRLDFDTQSELAVILGSVQHEIVTYMAFTSLWFLAFGSLMGVAKILGLWSPEKAKISSVIEQEAYRAESKRTVHNDISSLTAAAI